MVKDLRTAIVVNPDMPLGLIANTAGAIAIGLGAKVPELADMRLRDQGKREIDVSSKLPVPILQANSEVLTSLVLKALDADEHSAIVPFPSFARSLHNYEDYVAAFPSRDLETEQLDGVGLVGPAKWVRSLTGSLKLLR